jgi:hypothetical protein
MVAKKKSSIRCQILKLYSPVHGQLVYELWTVYKYQVISTHTAPLSHHYYYNLTRIEMGHMFIIRVVPNKLTY